MRARAEVAGARSAGVDVVLNEDEDRDEEMRMGGTAGAHRLRSKFCARCRRTFSPSLSLLLKSPLRKTYSDESLPSFS